MVRSRTILLGLLLLAACSSPPPKPAPFDPRAELERHHDEYWAHLASTYDRDGDGSVARGEYGRGEDSFARLDRDHDGAVTRADFDRDLVLPPDLVAPILIVRSAAGPAATSVTLADALAAVMVMDASGDGRVARNEFQAASPTGMVGIDRFGTLLAGMDADHDRLLSSPEIEQWLARRDVDGDGALAIRERATAGPAPLEGYLEPAARVAAPDFAATSAADGSPVTLSSLVGRKPIALIFGSFT